MKGEPRLLGIAHRAGNHLHLLREAEEAGADLIEADVWWYHGALEIRHLKTMGPVPLLWDRWKLVPAWAPRLHLGELLNAARDTTELMFDLKGHDLILPEALILMTHDFAPGRAFTVCSQSWDLLEPFRSHPHIRVAHSVGSRDQLRTVWSRLTWHDRHMVSIHRKLLDTTTVRLLKEHAPTVITWPINTPAALREAESWGVDGVISDSVELIRSMRKELKAEG